MTDIAVGPREVASLAVSPDSAAVGLGTTVQLTPVAYDAAGVAYVGVSASWSSSNPAVASVSSSGLVTAVALGSATITASSGVQSGTGRVVVTPPLISHTPEPVLFAATRNGPNPPDETVSITNVGSGTLDQLSVGTITYGPGASGWLGATLTGTNAPTTLTLSATTAGLPAGMYGATVPITSPLAGNSPHNVTATFTVVASSGVPASIAIVAGDNQTSRIGAPVPIDPSVLVLDQFGNPVSGIVVTFALGIGGGTMQGASQISDATGVATVTEWQLGNAAGASPTGTYANTLTATASGTGVAGNPVTFSGVGIYSFSLDVQPVFNGSCAFSSCHGATGSPPNLQVGNAYAQLVNVDATCDAGSLLRVKPDSAGVSVLMQRLDNTGTTGFCNTQMPPSGSLLPPATREIIRSWINNGALNN
ncbi:MAG: Ig-like domain-containing protein [Gemmatimonadales bacterium]